MRQQRGQIFVSHRAALIPACASALAAAVIAACTGPAPASAPATSEQIANDPGSHQIVDVNTGNKESASIEIANHPTTVDAPGATLAVTSDGRPDDLVDLGVLDRTIAIDMRYATADNFTGVAVYPVARCLLRRGVAERLVRVQKSLQKRGLGLKLWDCYRPISVQQRFWELVPDPRYVARPVIVDGAPTQGSRHNRGAAVDLTLVDARGGELPMPTAHDDFSARAHRNSDQHSALARRNMNLLQRAMEAEGFLPLATEWWHFDAPDWRRYPLSDIPMQRE